MKERFFGCTSEEMALYCAGLSKPQVERIVRRWAPQWPPRQRASQRFRLFESALEQAQRRAA